jgi:AbrB family looped-hinge helix DNA binding protein
MSEYRTTITRKGQVTIPIEIRRALDIKEGDLMTVHLNGDGVVMQRAEDVAERTAGIFAKYVTGPALSPKEEREAFERAVAEEVVESMNRS